ncbi:uncharacterized protein LOC116601609 [Nematostella vectensis]|uniref:uncharacterized protein LOC116601609 n=1 Tax=Nematostella vectensis TaxID=45351 RepID=UPI0020770C09|nr:uncharacterized protein LOC116601609 [Nematostella vectensis]
MQAKLQQLKSQKVFIQHLLNGILEKVLAASAPALAEREEKNLQSSCDGLQEEKATFEAQITAQAKNNAAKDARLVELKKEIEQAKTRQHAVSLTANTVNDLISAPI